jgi:serine/threonine protein kinase
MSGDEPESLEEQLPLWPAASDEALAAGAEPAALSQTASATARQPCGQGREVAPAVPLTSLGRFQIRRELGRGAFGVVFLAHDPHLGRDVALKVPRAEVLLTAELRARFQQEARVAAALDHPNLVPVYDAGQEGDICYIAAAYCPGITLAAWLKGRTGPVPWQPAARLLQTLAEAVAHAHERGVLHRDLKPSNILLQEERSPRRQDAKEGQEEKGGEPLSSSLLSALASLRLCESTSFVPKITDFGLAKLVAAAAEETGTGYATQTGAILGTPQYMAPEQAEGQSRTVGPCADVYGLGAILYELLTGRPPFVGETNLATLLLVRSQEPLPPARLRPGLPRDLETICLHCLHKEPGKRYPTARALAEDLARFLAGEPILARPVSSWERALKWARRRPAAAALVGVCIAAALVVATLIVVSNAQLREQRNLAEAKREEANAQRRRALAHLRSARDAVDRMLTVAQDRLAPAPYTLEVRRQLLEDALQLYQELARQEDDDPEIRYEVGRAWRRLGKIQVALGKREQVEQSCRQAVAVFEQLTALEPGQPAYWQELAASYNNLAGALDANQRPESERLLRRALALQDQLAAEHPQTLDYRLDASVTRTDLAGHLFATKRPEDALHASQEGIDGLEQLVAAEPSTSEYRYRLGLALNSRGAFLARGGRFGEAEPVFRRAVEVFSSLAEEPAAHAGIRSLLAMSCYNLGTLLAEHGSPGEGEKVLRRSVEVKRKLASDYPEVSKYHVDLGATLDKLAFVVRDRGEVTEAVRCWEEAIEHQRIALKANAADGALRGSLGNSWWNLAAARLKLGQHREVEQAAAEVPALLTERGQGDYVAAALLSHCVPLAEKDATLTAARREELVTGYASRAMEFLRQAIQKGYPDVASLGRQPAFEPLRSRPDFQQLLSDAIRKP